MRYSYGDARVNGYRTPSKVVPRSVMRLLRTFAESQVKA